MHPANGTCRIPASCDALRKALSLGWSYARRSHLEQRFRSGQPGRQRQDTFTNEDLRTGIAHTEYHVAFEIDQIDLKAREGWTVLVRGAAHLVDTEAERRPIINAGVEPWLEGEPEHMIQIRPAQTWATASAWHDVRSRLSLPTSGLAGPAPQSGHPEDSPRVEQDRGVRGHREVVQGAVVNGGDDGRAGKG